MNYKEILQLLGAGYSRAEIDAMVQPTVQPQVQPTVQQQVQPTVQPQVQPQVQPTVQPQVQPTVQPQVQPAIDYTALATAIVAAQQAANRAMNFGGQPQNDDLGKYF